MGNQRAVVVASLWLGLMMLWAGGALAQPPEGEGRNGASNEASRLEVPLPDFAGPAQRLGDAISDVVALADGGDAEEEDDNWDEPSGPVDKTPHISFVLQASYRSTWFRHETVLPDGSPVENENTFQIEHTHLKFSGDLSHKLSWELMPCLTHGNDFSVLTAHFAYELDPKLTVTAGRFLLPFGQFNLRSMPGMYAPISRPLLYQSHEDRFIQFSEGTPDNFLFTPREDIGVQLSGNHWLTDEIQLSYNGYVTNGLRATSNQKSRFFDDNNNSKMIGGRVGVGYNGDGYRLSVGGSGLRNKYEDQLDQVAWAVDATLRYSYRRGRWLTVRGEYADMTRDLQPNTLLLQGDEEIRGGYITVEADLTDTIAAFYQWDTLTNRDPTAVANLFATDVEITSNRHVVGLRKTIEQYLELKVEYGFWQFPDAGGVPDAHRLSIQTILAF